MNVPYPDQDLIKQLRSKFVGDGFKSLSSSEAISLINHLHQQTVDDARRIAELTEPTEAVKQTEGDENLVLAMSKMMSSNIDDGRTANTLYGALSEVVEANIEPSYDVRDWCIALEALARICTTIVNRERAYEENRSL